ncbi:hypothetical protein GIB67_013807 [Kingdonia uniflora]|uniref:Transposase-associated domain-containing protein n=1 Tax=Kingdonia uniflora TaxID=39325 RepID=A0A7J7N886_9MAGN|nr:hypothetical protein GIB67_013807 [Kingdonia uniflora]
MASLDIEDNPPRSVLQSTGVATTSLSIPLTLIFIDFPNVEVPVYINGYFSEVSHPNLTEKRSFDLYINYERSYGLIILPYNRVLQLLVTNITTSSSTAFSLLATNNSTLDPLMNVIEDFHVGNELTEGTNVKDVDNKPNLGGADWYSCPCVKCRNRKGKNDLEHINEHLLINGFDTIYTTWIYHGEQFFRFYVNFQGSTLPTNNVEDPCLPLVYMVNDTLEHLPNDINVEDEVNVEAYVETTTFTCNNKGVNQAQTNFEENVKYKELMDYSLLPLYIPLIERNIPN